MANTTLTITRAENYAIKIMNRLGLETNLVKDQFVSNVAETEPCIVNGVTIRTHIAIYDDASVRVEVKFQLPETAVLAEEYIEHVGKAEKLRKNKSGRYSTGPEYRDWSSSLLKKDTDVYSPWNNHYFCVDSNYYSAEEIDEAVNNAIELAKPFVNHLQDIQKLRYWKSTDEEVIAKAKEIIANADIHETDIDREYKAHYLCDRNSFIHGWFYPFNDRGKGTFDTLWPSSLDYAAKNMGNEGTFEYAVACIILEDKEYIAKARKACIIRKETTKEIY